MRLDVVFATGVRKAIHPLWKEMSILDNRSGTGLPYILQVNTSHWHCIDIEQVERLAGSRDAWQPAPAEGETNAEYI